ncbi:MAG TPA: DNA polymerase III subunit epsilon [Casimicrobiaceae bacterium]|jgi:DNA polymerase-3 subunit epsilon
MRHLILDTETTGLDPKLGHRIIEVAVLELVDRRPSGRHLHFRVDPEREIDAGATEVHGITWDDLRGKPRFAECVAEFVEFARGAEWVIHNAPFDVAFLDAEFARLGMPACAAVAACVTDTLALARDTFPGKRNSLDALCERFGVDNTQRNFHGALLDAQLLAEVWLALTRGQETLAIDRAPAPLTGAVAVHDAAIDVTRMRVVLPTAEELAAHDAYLATLDRDTQGHCLWLALLRAEPAAA